jgi:hypothetical protein
MIVDLTEVEIREICKALLLLGRMFKKFDTEFVRKILGLVEPSYPDWEILDKFLDKLDKR